MNTKEKLNEMNVERMTKLLTNNIKFFKEQVGHKEYAIKTLKREIVYAKQMAKEYESQLVEVSKMGDKYISCFERAVSQIRLGMDSYRAERKFDVCRFLESDGE